MNQNKPDSGFTQIEMMIAIAILAILTVVAMPAVGSFMQRNTLLGASNSMITSLNFTRSQAVTSNQRIIMCASSNIHSDDPLCDGGNQWHDGWLIYADENSNNERNSGEPILRVDELPDGISDHLSSYVRRIRAGEEIVLTSRHRPVARMLPIDEPAQGGISALRLVRWTGERPLGGTQRPQIENASAATVVLEDRR
jgi:type IV fimbrial biogenesis protein FimT